jgi:NADH-quinone oxidoreductase subunit I
VTDETPEQALETHQTHQPHEAPEAPGRKKVPGSGLVQGLATTFKNMTTRAHTHQYPDVAPELPPRTRGVIALIEENCTSCMLCARECPDWCIYIDSHKETIPAPTTGGRERSRNVLDRFAIDYSLCMYCGICIEVCPFDALEWSPEFEYAEYDIKEMLHEKDRLTQWVETIPPPVALDDAAEEPKEISLAQKAAAKKQAALDAAAQAPAPAPAETESPAPAEPESPAATAPSTPAPSDTPDQEAKGDA